MTLVYEIVGRKKETPANNQRKYLTRAKKYNNVLLIAVQVFVLMIGDKNEYLKYVELFSMVRLIIGNKTL